MYGIKALLIGIKFHSLGLYFNILWFLNINKPWVAGKKFQRGRFNYQAHCILHAEPGEGSIHVKCTVYLY